jgi:hypothetical protein
MDYDLHLRTITVHHLIILITVRDSIKDRTILQVKTDADFEIELKYKFPNTRCLRNSLLLIY